MTISLGLLGTYETGLFDQDAALASGYDPLSQRLFVINGSTQAVDVLSLSDPDDPFLLFSIDVTPFGSSPSSIAVSSTGIVAVAVEGDTPQATGTVAFFDATGELLGTASVGATPRSLTFTPDGNQLLVANAGEPTNDYAVDPEGSISIVDLTDGPDATTVQSVDFTAFNAQEATLSESGVRIFGPGATVAQDLEPESITLSDDALTAYITLQENNAVAILDLTTATITDIFALGTKDHSLPGNEIDASDDGAIDIAAAPVQGLYQPGAIASYTVNGATFFVMANEGASRDSLGFSEEAVVADLTLDPTVFPPAPPVTPPPVTPPPVTPAPVTPAPETPLVPPAPDLAFTADEVSDLLGDLTVSTVDSDPDGDGDVDQLLAFGGRSFSIWDASGNLVYDSGADFEQITAETLPQLFNADNTDNTSDTQSNNSGPEPSDVVVGQVGDRTYAFTSLASIGGVMVYDITDPLNVTFVQYVNNRNADGVPLAGTAGDLGPDNLTFIAAEDSPTNGALLAIPNQVSGTTTVYGIFNPIDETTEIVINEIRTNQPGANTDHYFELSGPPNTSLNGLTYLVIGDGAGGSGVIEAVVDLTDQVLDKDGLFLAAESTFSLGEADLVTFLNFENNDNVTHVLVQGFTGSLNDDLDIDDDGVLDTVPWGKSFDSVSIVQSLTSGDKIYSDTVVGPNVFLAPNHIYRVSEEEDPPEVDPPVPSNPFEIGPIGPVGNIIDTPGRPNDEMLALTPIYDIQGAGHTSPLDGQLVMTTGIVTGVDDNGFYLQAAVGDGDIATSDALFVFTDTLPNLLVGDAVDVQGTVDEFIPDGADSGNLSITQLIDPVVSRLSGGNTLPTTVIIGPDGRIPPTETIDDDQPTAYNLLTEDLEVYEPDLDGIDFYESLEGMLVTVNAPEVVGATNSAGEIFAYAGGTTPTGLSDRGTLNISPDDFNPERIQIDPDSTVSPEVAPLVNVGDTLSDVTGVVGYSDGHYEVIPTEAFTASAGTLAEETSALMPTDDQLTIASYNVLNLDPVVEDVADVEDGDLGNVDDDLGNGHFAAIAADIVDNLNAPDIIGLQDIQDNDGAEISDVSSADVTFQTLIDAIIAAGGPTYQFIDTPDIVPASVDASGNVVSSTGGQPGGNSRVGYLYNPDRVSLVEDSVVPLTDSADQAVNADNPFFGSRIPLAATFLFNQEEVTVVNSHFTSKSDSAPLFGQTQPATELQSDPLAEVNGGLGDRIDQAEAVQSFVSDILAEDSDANIVALGGFNEFEFLPPLEILEQDLNNLTNTLAENERYSVVSQGNSQSLDHILVSDSLNASAEFDIVHLNSEFATTVASASDRDPLLVQVTIAAPIVPVEDLPADPPLAGAPSDEDPALGSTSISSPATVVPNAIESSPSLAAAGPIDFGTESALF